jgi:hypothetical protein
MLAADRERMLMMMSATYFKRRIFQNPRNNIKSYQNPTKITSRSE